jgi:transcriptional regulator with XRE-family HTH domain
VPVTRRFCHQRQSAGLSETEVAARMGTWRSAVARPEAGAADLPASTPERYAGALGSEITWQLGDGQGRSCRDRRDPRDAAAGWLLHLPGRRSRPGDEVRAMLDALWLAIAYGLAEERAAAR